MEDQLVDVPFAAERVELGRTGLSVSRLCLGTAGWSDARSAEDDSIATALRFAEGPLNYLDTSNNYGQSEERIGKVIAMLGGRLPDGVVLQTKLDRDPVTNDFSAARMRRSLEESLSRLGVDRLPMLFLHDPENTTYEFAMSEGGPVEQLVAFRDEGIVDHIGISGAPVDLLTRFVDTGLFDALITHSRYTLVDHSATELIRHANESGLGVLNAAPFGGGILSSFPVQLDMYGYQTVSPAVLDAAQAMGALLQRHGIPLPAAALQFSMRNADIHSTIVGALTPDQLDGLFELAELPIADELWGELDALAPDPADWLY
ncbi:aldo/keto reductase [Humibacter sp.]|jgi:D-threo-aldose 1-dehydrogenase|uniref:aldo/keto reductase n=1 Tax=Humibacter sp. TaxID=1940291 RepID=UPI002C990903|nr:aldo/keto reductase [Humibacter sp.]HVX07035.1 aldo/keto reductase [Humibacter sp.]